MKKKLLFLLALILAFSLGSACLAALAGRKGKAKEGLLAVTSFYPMYILTRNLTEGADGIRVENLAGRHSGCLHDYTLTTEDMRLLSEADLVVANGGVEPFLAELAKKLPGLTFTEAADGYPLLAGTGHTHEENGGKAAEEQGNAHIWLSIEGYLYETDRVAEALAELNPAQAKRYFANAGQYRQRLEELREEADRLKALAAGKEAVIFHEAFAYLAESLGIKAACLLPLDEDTALSAGELAEVIEEIRRRGITMLWVEEAYRQTADGIAAETGAIVCCLDPFTGGEDSLFAYEDKMAENIRRIRAALE